MDLIEVVFVTVPHKVLERLSAEDLGVEDILLDYGTTDREGDGYLVLLNGQQARVFLDDLLEVGILLDYTVFSLPVPILLNRL